MHRAIEVSTPGSALLPNQVQQQCMASMNDYTQHVTHPRKVHTYCTATKNLRSNAHLRPHGRLTWLTWGTASANMVSHAPMYHTAHRANYRMSWRAMPCYAVLRRAMLGVHVVCCQLADSPPPIRCWPWPRAGHWSHPGPQTS